MPSWTLSILPSDDSTQLADEPRVDRPELLSLRQVENSDPLNASSTNSSSASLGLPSGSDSRPVTVSVLRGSSGSTSGPHSGSLSGSITESSGDPAATGGGWTVDELQTSSIGTADLRNSAATNQPILMEAVPASNRRDRLMSIAAIVWISVCSLLVFRWMIHCFQARRLLSSCQPIPSGDLQLSLSDLCSKLAIKRCPKLLTHGEIESPMVAGLSKPSLILPESMLKWPEDRIRMVMIHEL
ncbi:MAG: M56 family metallopeptidase, partial [Planctomycetota bacterium]